MRASSWWRGMRCAVWIGTFLGSAAMVHAQSAPARVAVWDTKTAAATRLSAEDLANTSAWEQKSRNEKAPSFQGDAVVTNGQITVALRKQAAELDLYSGASDKAVWRAALRLQTLSSEPAARLDRVTLVTNTRGAAALEAVYQTATGDSISARFRLKRGGVSLEVAPGPGAGALRVACPSRYVVLPDFFADDMLIDATRIPVSMAEVPSENFLLHLTGNGDAIAMCVFENSDQDVQVTFTGEEDHRIATGSTIEFGEGRKVWVALMDGAGIWHAFDVKEEDAGKIMPLGWKMPFAAQWRTDFTRRNDLTDSWEMLYPDEKGDGYIKPTWLPSGSHGGAPSVTATGEIDVDAYKVGGPASNRLGPDRQRWITVLGRYRYPCWTDKHEMGFVQPLEHKRRDDLMFRGPAVLYPINRLPATPTDTFTAVDVVRNTLGVGPCQYILNVEGQHQDHVGRATCHVRRLLNEIYENGQQKSRQQDIEIYLGDGLDFVRHIRGRIDHYIAFGHEMRKYLAAQKQAHPELEKALAEMEKIVAELDERLQQHREGIKSPEYVVALNEDFRKNLLDYEGPDSLERLKQYTDALTHVGGNQDELVGECRSVVRALRQRAALTMAVDPRFEEIAKEIRTRTQKVLLKPSAYEGARH